MKKTFLIIFSFILIISGVNFRVFADNEVVVNINEGDTVSIYDLEFDFVN